MRPYIAIDSKDMPAPDKKVRYAQGMFGPAMFHYSPEHADPIETAKANGFDIKIVRMVDELDDEHPLFKLYFEQGECEKVFTAWLPKTPEGWKIAGCHDTEDGPTAVFLRKIIASPATDDGGRGE